MLSESTERMQTGATAGAGERMDNGRDGREREGERRTQSVSTYLFRTVSQRTGAGRVCECGKGQSSGCVARVAERAIIQ